MNAYDKIHLGALLKALFVKVFSNKFCMAILDLLMTIFISIHTASVNWESSKWITRLIIYCIIAIAINGLCILADFIKKVTKRHINTLMAHIVYKIKSIMKQHLNCIGLISESLKLLEKEK